MRSPAEGDDSLLSDVFIFLGCRCELVKKWKKCGMWRIEADIRDDKSARTGTSRWIGNLHQSMIEHARESIDVLIQHRERIDVARIHSGSGEYLYGVCLRKLSDVA